MKRLAFQIKSERFIYSHGDLFHTGTAFYCFLQLQTKHYFSLMGTSGNKTKQKESFVHSSSNRVTSQWRAIAFEKSAQTCIQSLCVSSASSSWRDCMLGRVCGTAGVERFQHSPLPLIKRGSYTHFSPCTSKSFSPMLCYAKLKGVKLKPAAAWESRPASSGVCLL